MGEAKKSFAVQIAGDLPKGGATFASLNNLFYVSFDSICLIRFLTILRTSCSNC